MQRVELEPPTHCDSCCSLNVDLICNSRLYGKPVGEWPKIYFCNDCKAAVGCHAGTDKPLGRMADAHTRKLRSRAHDEFDRLWRAGYMTRDKAYKWLSLELGIELDNCHISWLTKDQLKQAATVSKKYIEENAKALIRRKRKQDANQLRRNEREHKQQQYKRKNR